MLTLLTVLTLLTWGAFTMIKLLFPLILVFIIKDSHQFNPTSLSLTLTPILFHSFTLSFKLIIDLVIL